MKTIRVAVKEPLKEWKIREVEDALPSYQKIVGGYVEGVGDQNQQFEAWRFCSSFDITDVTSCDKHNVGKFLL